MDPSPSECPIADDHQGRLGVVSTRSQHARTHTPQPALSEATLGSGTLTVDSYSHPFIERP
jgi:hypothetical protein